MNIQDQIDSAPEAREFRYTNIGLLTIDFIRLTWHGKGVAPTREVLVDGMEVKPGDHSLEAMFEIDCTPVRSNGFVVKRKTNIERSSGTRVTSWSKIVEPSLVKVFGKKWVTSASGKYVAMQDTNNLEGRKRDDGSLWSVPQFLESYPDLGAAQAADEALRSSNGPATDTTGLIAELVKEAKQLAVAFGTTERGPVFTQMDDSGRLGNVTPEQINDIFTQAGL